MALHRSHRAASIAIVALVLLAIVAPTSGVAAASTYTRDLYFSGAYERQVDGRTCTAGSTAMMLNMIARRDLRLDQMAILRYAQRNDALPNATQRGSDPLGWSRAATYFSSRTGRPTTYKWQAFGSKGTALRAAAVAIAKLNRPVGLLVWNGRHAIVMTGYEATGDPKTGSFTLRSVYTSDPYWSGPTVGRHRRWSVATAPLNQYLELDATAYYDRAWYRKWVIVAPVATIATPAPSPSPSPTPTPAPTPVPIAQPRPSAEQRQTSSPTTTPTPSPSPTSTSTPEPTTASPTG